MAKGATSGTERSYFSALCIERCGGLCCAPWWGIISYRVVKQGGLSGMAAFREELARGLMERQRRIVTSYVTSEDPPRPLFTGPERYNLVIRDIAVQGTTLTIDLMAMFAFNCRFLSDERMCTIHPSVFGGEDIRPPHCGYMGTPGARSGEKGYCRIIEAASSSDDEAVSKAIDIERMAGERNFRQGFATAGEAAKKVTERLRDYCSENFAYLLPREKAVRPGRNEPCPCGSGKKFKKCHGR